MSAAEHLQPDPEDRFLDALGLPTTREAQAARDSRRLFKIIMLSPTIEVCEALLRGESVPVDRLDPEWVRRYGLQ